MDRDGFGHDSPTKITCKNLHSPAWSKQRCTLINLDEFVPLKNGNLQVNSDVLITVTRSTFWEIGIAGEKARADKKHYMPQRRPGAPTMDQYTVVPSSDEHSETVQHLPGQTDSWVLEQLCHWPAAPLSCWDWPLIYQPLLFIGLWLGLPPALAIKKN